MKSYEIETAAMQRRATRALAVFVVLLAAIVAGYVWLLVKVAELYPRVAGIGLGLVAALLLIAIVRRAAGVGHDQ